MPTALTEVSTMTELSCLLEYLVGFWFSRMHSNGRKKKLKI